MLKRGHKIMVNALGLVIASCFLRRLVLEARKLAHGIVQLCVGVANFLAQDEELEALSQSLLAAVPLRQRRHNLWVLSDEGGMDDVILNVMATQFIKQPGTGPWWWAIKLQLSDQVVKNFSC